MRTNFLILIMIILLSGCTTWDMMVHPGNYIPRDTPREKEYIYDTIRITNDNGSITSAAISGLKPAKQLTFSKIGQQYSFKQGETIEIISDGVDFSQTTFDIELNEESKEIELKLVDKDYSKVQLTSKCQTIVRTGIEYVPKIEIAKGLKPEQIIVTPLCDGAGSKIGYEIRYGSEERGCRKEAKQGLLGFKKCRDDEPPHGGKPGPDPCKLKRKLGIPCTK